MRSSFPDNLLTRLRRLWHGICIAGGHDRSGRHGKRSGRRDGAGGAGICGAVDAPRRESCERIAGCEFVCHEHCELPLRFAGIAQRAKRANRPANRRTNRPVEHRRAKHRRSNLGKCPCCGRKQGDTCNFAAANGQCAVWSERDRGAYRSSNRSRGSSAQPAWHGGTGERGRRRGG